jgi:hypothetical protein
VRSFLLFSNFTINFKLDDSTSAINSNAAMPTSSQTGLMQGNTLITKLIQPTATVASVPVAGPSNK